MQGQMSWNPPASIPARPNVARTNGFVSPTNIGPYSFPQANRSAPTFIRPQPSTWQNLHVSNEDYGNLVSQGFGSSWQSEVPTHSHHSSECCSPPGPEQGWISPSDEPELYLSPSWLQESSNSAFTPLPIYNTPSQVSNSDSEDDTVCAQSPGSVSYMIPPPATTYAGPVGFEMELDDPTTVDNDEDGEEETTIDEADAYEESTSEELDTTIDYSYLRGAVESPHGLESFPGTFSKRLCAVESGKHTSVPTFFASVLLALPQRLLALLFGGLVDFGLLCPLFRFLEEQKSEQGGWVLVCVDWPHTNTRLHPKKTLGQFFISFSKHHLFSVFRF